MSLKNFQCLCCFHLDKPCYLAGRDCSMCILIAKENKFVACIIVVYQLTFFSVFLFPFDYFSTFFNFFLRLTFLLTTASLWWNRNNYYNLTLSLSMIANNSPYSLLRNLYDVSSENLVLDQLWYSTLLSLLVGLTLSPVILKGEPLSWSLIRDYLKDQHIYLSFQLHVKEML